MMSSASAASHGYAPVSAAHAGEERRPRSAARRSPRAPARALAVAAIVLVAGAAAAQPPPAPGPVAASADEAEAGRHFKRGGELLEQGSFAAALAEFRASQRLFPKMSAVYNAAICLGKLRRDDEALETYERLLREYEGRLRAEMKEAAQREVLRLRALVGTLELAGVEAGTAVSVDGQSRGEYPLPGPLRVVAGNHLVRLGKEGFEPFETRVDVAGDTTARVVARLRALERSGRLRVAEQGGGALTVLIDGSVAGETPWEGRLAVGDHVVVLRGEGDLGTLPVPVVIELNHTTPLTLAAEALDAVVRVEPTPVNAGVAVDGVSVGRGIWEGRLRTGAHRLEVSAPGFAPSLREVTLEAGKPSLVTVALERDRSSPFWRAPARPGRFIAEIGASVALLPTLGGDVAGGCTDACSGGTGVGGLAVLHAGYELGSGLGLGVTGGVLLATQGLTGRQTTLTPLGMTPDGGQADDRLLLRGALAGAWAGWSFLGRVPVHLRLGAGAVIGSVRDARTFDGTASDGAPFQTGPVTETHDTWFVYVTPEARVGLPLGPHVELSLGFAVPILVDVSPPRWNGASPIYAGSDRAGTFPSETLVGRAFVLFAPGVGARYDF
jgi:hypothetical protein